MFNENMLLDSSEARRSTMAGVAITAGRTGTNMASRGTREIMTIPRADTHKRMR